jgi:hypothetical protein
MRHDSKVNEIVISYTPMYEGRKVSLRGRMVRERERVGGDSVRGDSVRGDSVRGDSVREEEDSRGEK